VSATGIIGWFEEVGLGDRPRVGGKGASLGELTRAGIVVPPGFIVTTAAFVEFIVALEREAPVREAVARLAPGDLAAIQACSAGLRARICGAALPATMSAALGEAHAALCARSGFPQVAVRSSATTEDASDASFAGLQDTYLWIGDAPGMLEHVRRCWASLYSVESISYRRDRGIDESVVAMAVVIQSRAPRA
jgi:pyruvate,water dikinase